MVLRNRWMLIEVGGVKGIDVSPIVNHFHFARSFKETSFAAGGAFSLAPEPSLTPTALQRSIAKVCEQRVKVKGKSPWYTTSVKDKVINRRRRVLMDRRRAFAWDVAVSGRAGGAAVWAGSDEVGWEFTTVTAGGQRRGIGTDSGVQYARHLPVTRPARGQKDAACSSMTVFIFRLYRFQDTRLLQQLYCRAVPA